MAKKINLNEMRIPTDHATYDDHRPLDDHSGTHGEVTVYFRNIKERLIEFIGGSTHVLGCVAWLTDYDILDALSKVSCSIVVQKEDFLRPDYGSHDNFRDTLKRKYSALRNTRLETRYEAMGVVNEMSYQGDPEIDAVRCVGNFNREKSPAFPRMHNKFLVSCSEVKEDGATFLPGTRVWTGSFNFTKNAGMSFENAVVINQQKIAWAYYKEWSQITALSEPLNWQSDWCAPEWRIGS